MSAKKCAECGKRLTLKEGYAEYQHGIVPNGESLRHYFCLPCDAAEPDSIDLSDPRITPDGTEFQPKGWDHV